MYIHNQKQSKTLKFCSPKVRVVSHLLEWMIRNNGRGKGRETDRFRHCSASRRKDRSADSLSRESGRSLSFMCCCACSSLSLTMPTVSSPVNFIQFSSVQFLSSLRAVQFWLARDRLHITVSTHPTHSELKTKGKLEHISGNLLLHKKNTATWCQRGYWVS